MVPGWVIEELARARRDREVREERRRARLWIEVPERHDREDEPEQEPAGSVVVWSEVP